MTRIALVLPVLLLTACDSGRKVDVKDANVSEVSEAVAKSGIAGDDDFKVRPGKWESKVAILEMEIPGMPASMQETMKRTMAEHQPSSFIT